MQAKLKTTLYYSLGVLSALFLVLAFPPYSKWAFSFVGLVPLCLGLFYAKNYKQVYWLGHSCAIIFILFGFYWVSYAAIHYGELPWVVGQITLLLFSLFAEVQFLVFAFLFYFFLKKYGQKNALYRAVIFLGLLPLLYVGFDFFYPKIFPTTLGQCLYGWFSVAQIAEFGGVYFLTWLILVSNISISWIIYSKIQFKRIDYTALVVLLGLSALLFAAHLYGKSRILELRELEKAAQDSLKVSVIQGNIGDIDKVASERGFQPAVQYVLNTYRTLSLSAKLNHSPDLIVWPETSYPFLYTHHTNERANQTGNARDQWIDQVIDELDTALYFGGYSSFKEQEFNSSFLVLHTHELAGTYRKSILLAFGEYIPLGPLSPLVQSIVPTIANFGRGPGPSVIPLRKKNGAQIMLGPQICYEGIIPEFSRQEAQKGAQVLLNITNDSWFGLTSEPALHLLLTVFRSIELRRPMIRSTNTGISTYIDITGQQHFNTDLFSQKIMTADIPILSSDQTQATFYYKHGDLFAKLCEWILFIYGSCLLIISRKKFIHLVPGIDFFSRNR